MQIIKPKFTILLPTYNESENITPLLKEIEKALKELVFTYEILFVDDSIDGTASVIKQHIKTDRNIRLLHRPKKDRTGLATAIAFGIENARGEYVCCLDSDLQHPPAVIPDIIEKIIKEKADIVVASRYTEGGDAGGLKTRFRKFVSHLTRIVTRIIIPQTKKTTDPGSGFFIIRKSVLKKISRESLYGYKILIDILARNPKACVQDIPYFFTFRVNNESKATFNQGVQFIRQIIKLYFTFQFFKTLKIIFLVFIITILFYVASKYYS